MRLDHIAYRTADRTRTADFFIKAFGYRIQTEFDLKFDDGSTARCIALEPPEKIYGDLPWKTLVACGEEVHHTRWAEYHMAPEIFVSDGDPQSIVGQWVAKRDGIGGIHHLAYQVPSVKSEMNHWKQKGFAEFTTENPLTCPDLTQVFTKPSALTGVIYEFIERGKHGFCADNVKDLMLSTKDLESEVKVVADHPGAIIQ